jgi:hypothetical protein
MVRFSLLGAWHLRWKRQSCVCAAAPPLGRKALPMAPGVMGGYRCRHATFPVLLPGVRASHAGVRPGTLLGVRILLVKARSLASQGRVVLQRVADTPLHRGTLLSRHAYASEGAGWDSEACPPPLGGRTEPARPIGSTFAPVCLDYSTKGAPSCWIVRLGGSANRRPSFTVAMQSAAAGGLPMAPKKHDGCETLRHGRRVRD